MVRAGSPSGRPCRDQNHVSGYLAGLQVNKELNCRQRQRRRSVNHGHTPARVPASTEAPRALAGKCLGRKKVRGTGARFSSGINAVGDAAQHVLHFANAGVGIQLIERAGRRGGRDSASSAIAQLCRHPRAFPWPSRKPAPAAPCDPTQPGVSLECCASRRVRVRCGMPIFSEISACRMSSRSARRNSAFTGKPSRTQFRHRPAVKYGAPKNQLSTENVGNRAACHGLTSGSSIRQVAIYKTPFYEILGDLGSLPSRTTRRAGSPASGTSAFEAASPSSLTAFSAILRLASAPLAAKPS
jgi:hypothetical protein